MTLLEILIHYDKLYTSNKWYMIFSSKPIWKKKHQQKQHLSCFEKLERRLLCLSAQSKSYRIKVCFLLSEQTKESTS